MTLVRETLLPNQHHPWTDEGNCDHLWLEGTNDVDVEAVINRYVLGGWTCWIFGTNSVTQDYSALLLKFMDK